MPQSVTLLRFDMQIMRLASDSEARRSFVRLHMLQTTVSQYFSVEDGGQDKKLRDREGVSGQLLSS